MNQFELEAERIQSAYEAYRGVYSTMTPPPTKEEFKQDNVWVKIFLAVIVLASMVVSGSHTIPVFANGNEWQNALVGISAFFMLEAAIVTYAFIRTQRHYRVEREEPKSMKWFIAAGLGIAFMVALLANIEYMLKQYGIVIGNAFRLFILLGLATSAPSLAFITGDILAMYAVLDRVQLIRHEENYRKQHKEWQEELMRSWNANKAKWGGSVKIEVQREMIDSSVSNGNSNGKIMENMHVLPSKSSIGHSKQPQASKIVREFFESNPNELQGNAIEIAQRLGVGKSTVYNLMKEMQPKELNNA